ncbi:hypothetical protein [Sporocytophaga myxococcoides]|jgi:hypothetical protein|nr:hypothetical protein [Sporocytophaga myxococcoides]
MTIDKMIKDITAIAKRNTNQTKKLTEQNKERIKKEWGLREPNSIQSKEE